MKKLTTSLVLCGFIAFCASPVRAGDFEMAAALLNAAKKSDINAVQSLINSGADINYIDNTGMSLVCTSIMNRDMDTAKILQMYGADASNCDRQIKNNRARVRGDTSGGGGGFFGGLSNPQSIALTTVAVAGVAGGILLLSNAFGSDNENASSGGGGERPGGGGGGGNGGGTAIGTAGLPYGPAMPNAASETDNFSTNLEFWAGSEDNIFQRNFNMMSQDFGYNYLLMTNGYVPLARGYLGMRTLRNTTTNAPLDISSLRFGTNEIMGGRPVNTAIISANGINATDDSSLGDNLMAWAVCNSSDVSQCQVGNDMVSSKYYNNNIIRGGDNSSLADDTTEETATGFDLSGDGTAIHNDNATAMDNLIAQTVGGRASGYSDADFVGFAPNAQMAIFRTGGGKKITNITDGDSVATLVDDNANGVWDSGEKVDVNGDLYEIEFTDGTNNFTATGAGGEFSGTVGANGLYYVNNVGYKFDNLEFITAQEISQMDYKNYTALRTAANLWNAGDLAGGRSRPDIIANASIIEPLSARDSDTVSDVLAVAGSDRAALFGTLVNRYYDVEDTEGPSGTNLNPGTDAISFFNGLGSAYSPLVVFGTGRVADGIGTHFASFENSAPLVFSNLEHLFASVVAVNLLDGGTTNATNIGGWTPSGKYTLSKWNNFTARACGTAGRGLGTIDPWCFAAAGVTDELAVASFAGAATAIKSAFSYMDSKQIFTLLALTADGPFLASNMNGTGMTRDELRVRLQNMYSLPNDMQALVDGGRDYFEVFGETFGYGLINLHRATQPTTRLWFYDGNNIVSGSNNAYWRSASKSNLSLTGAFGARGIRISADAYDILESVDGTVSLPRVFENNISLNNGAGRSIGNALWDFSISKNSENSVELSENLKMSMRMSDAPANDNMGGLSDLKLSFAKNNFEITTAYQKHFSNDNDSILRGDKSNTVLSLVDNAVSTNVNYKSGKFNFGVMAMVGNMSEYGLLENDPIMSDNFAMANLGAVSAGEFNIEYNANDKFNLKFGIGNMMESNTVLGAYGVGFLEMNDSNTTYFDARANYKISDKFNLWANYTNANTNVNNFGEMIMGVSNLKSNAFAFGAEIGNFDVSVSRPLAVVDGMMQYADSDFAVNENDNGGYGIVSNSGIKNIDLSAQKRETIFGLSYRANIDEKTDGAFGVIYRMNPNHVSDVDDEMMFMLKVKRKI